MIIMSSIEMRVQALHEGVPAPARLIQVFHGMHDVKQVSPLIAIGPPLIRARLASVRVPRLHHEPTLLVEDGKGCA